MGRAAGEGACRSFVSEGWTEVAVLMTPQQRFWWWLLLAVGVLLAVGAGVALWVSPPFDQIGGGHGVEGGLP
ncbi:hypothetical protein EBN88_17390 [Streptomyces triticirhizae]|uniref:Uncharacterized protein n=1 Tax=Streptomyces triticirhizae TaxID=2483353 RepID=A0A3M2LL83_9ACTN|nr:hypothetical protein EBN88_17390 [Streptomyces triticirhizae]